MESEAEIRKMRVHPMLNNLKDRVAETIHAHKLLEPQDRILVAVSGGADSVCLLYTLHALGYPVEVAHFDHQTRDGASTADAVFVRELAVRLGVPCHATSCPVREEALASGKSFEDYARELRYAFFVQVATKIGCRTIATGHHRDDQAETVLMRLIRGTSPHGLAGIPYCRPSVDGLQIIRPLLDCTRDEIQKYLSENGFSFCEDISNTDIAFQRNRIRHTLLPFLIREGFNPSICNALNRLADVQREENTLLAEMTDVSLKNVCSDTCTISRKAFRALHMALQRRVVVELVHQHGGEAAFEHVDAAVHLICTGDTGDQCDLGRGLMLANGRETSHFVEGGLEEISCVKEVELVVPGTTSAFNTSFTTRLLEHVPQGPLSTYCTPCRQVFDADLVSCPLVVRARRDGDRFTPFGMSGSKKLQDYFVDQGVPAVLRDREQILTAAGRILWVVGRAIDAYAAVTTSTQRWLEIEVSDETK